MEKEIDVTAIACAAKLVLDEKETLRLRGEIEQFIDYASSIKDIQCDRPYAPAPQYGREDKVANGQPDINELTSRASDGYISVPLTVEE